MSLVNVIVDNSAFGHALSYGVRALRLRKNMRVWLTPINMVELSLMEKTTERKKALIKLMDNISAGRFLLDAQAISAKQIKNQKLQFANIKDKQFWPGIWATYKKNPSATLEALDSLKRHKLMNAVYILRIVKEPRLLLEDIERIILTLRGEEIGTDTDLLLEVAKKYRSMGSGELENEYNRLRGIAAKRVTAEEYKLIKDVAPYLEIVHTAASSRLSTKGFNASRIKEITALYNPMRIAFHFLLKNLVIKGYREKKSIQKGVYFDAEYGAYFGFIGKFITADKELGKAIKTLKLNPCLVLK